MQHSDIGSGTTVVQVMDSLGKNRGGLTKAVMQRFRLLAENERAVLVTVAYQPDVRSIFEELIRDGSLPAHAELLNYYQDQRETSRPNVPGLECPYLDWGSDPVYRAAPEPALSGEVVRHFRKGTFVGVMVRDVLSRLRHVDVHDESRPWIRLYRDTVWSDGRVSRREYFDDHNRVRFRVYVDAEGRPFLSVWVNENGYEYRTVEHLAEHSVLAGDTRGANALWLERKLKEFGRTVVYTDEPRTTFALAVGGSNVHHVTSIHTTHYQNNRDNKDGLKHWVGHYTKNFERICKIVFFTETQRDDFVEDTGCDPAKTLVVPHAAPHAVAASMAPARRRPERLVAVSRLAPDKRLEDAIRAFAGVVSELPSAEFKIYGEGPAKNSLNKLIADLGLASSVSLEGHTAKPLTCFAEASASILTTKYEGFGLVITESFTVGTPVIAYDVIYGPRDVIVSEENGLLVPDGDVVALSKAMVRALTDEQLRNRMSSGARATSNNFSPTQWKTGWSESFRGHDDQPDTHYEGVLV